MKIVCCDDDKNVGILMERYIREYFRMKNLEQPEYAFFSSGEEVLRDEKVPDIVFLDVEMPGLSGIHVGQELKKKNSRIIIFIVTSYMDYLDEAFRTEVFRFLSKPIDRNRLFRNLKDALAKYYVSIKLIQIETKTGIEVICASDIVCVEAKNKKVFIHTKEKVVETVQKMAFWQEQLTESCFFQTHRSFIVNMKYVSAYDRELVYLCGGKYKAYLTRRKYTDFKNANLMYLESMR